MQEKDKAELDWDRVDIVKAIQPIITNGDWYWRCDNGKLDRKAPGIETRTPWIYWHSEDSPCYFCNDVVFKLFDLLPCHCANCYKVVVVPTTVMELFKLCDLQQQMEGHPCKCGVEIRDEVGRLYGGYFYNIGLEEGLQRYRLVREMVDKYVGEHVKVGLKKACTEFEARFGPSDQWELRPGQKEFEERLESFFMPQPKIKPQHDEFKKHVKAKWVQFAHSRGDMTYKEMTGGQPLYEPYVLYAGEL